MSFLLAEWLNQDLQVSPKVPPSELDSVLQSGKLLGDILFKLGLIDDSSEYSHGSSSESALKNYSLAERILRDQLGIPLSSNEAFDLIQGKPGCAAKLLYQMKAAHSRLPPRNPLDRKIVSFKSTKEKEDDDESYPGSRQGPPLPLAKPPTPSKIQRYKDKEHVFFTDLLRAKLNRLQRGKLSYPTRNARIEETKTKSLVEKNLVESPALDAALPKAPLIKETRTPVIKNPFNLKQVQDQKERQEAAKKMEKLAALKERERVARREVLAQERRQRLAQSFADQIDQFEAKNLPSSLTLSTGGGETGTNRPNPASGTTTSGFSLADADPTHIVDAIQRSKLDSLSHLKSLAKKLPPVQVSYQQSAAYLGSIKAQKAQEEVAKKERDLRRRKLLLAEQLAQEDLERKRMEELVTQKLQRHSKQERRIAEQLMRVRHEKQVIKENRIARERQYAERRQQDYMEAIEREFELAERAREEFKKQTALKLAQHLEILEAKKAAKHEKNIETISSLVNDLLDLSLKVSEYRSLNDNQDLPPKLLRQWKTLFLHEQPVYKDFEISINKEKVAPAEEIQNIEPELGPGIAALDDSEFKDYLDGTNDWSYTSTAESQEPIVPSPNEALAVIVDDVLTMATDVKPIMSLVNLPQQQLKLAILGKPFSGKSSLARSLASKHNLKVIDANSLIKESLVLSNGSIASSNGSRDPLTTGTKTKKPSKANIGQKIQHAMLEGSAPDDSLLLSLVLDAIKEVEAQGEQGWVLTDFPKNRNQALLLEKGLTGYVEPVAPKIGGLKRDVNRSRQHSELHQQPKTAKPEDENPKSGLDCVLWLDVSNEVSFKRALGQKIDSLTQVQYHLSDASPPLDEPGLHARLVDVEDDSETKKQIHYEIANFENNESAIRTLYQKFSNLKVFDGAKTNDWTLQEVYKVVTEITLAKHAALSPSEVPESASVHDARPSSETKSTIEATSSSGLRPDTGIKDLSSSLSAQGFSYATSPNGVCLYHPGHMVRNTHIDGRKFTTKELAGILADEWIKIESSYTDKVKFLFRALRKEKDVALHYFHDTKKNFKKFLERPDRKQDLVDLFQREYNAIEEDFRSDGEVKAELHHRVDDLREKLWELSDVKKDEADNERLAIIEDRWVEDHSVIIQNIYISMIQAEVDRYIGTKQFLNDYFKDAYGSVISENRLPSVTVPLTSAYQASPIDIASPLSAHHQEFVSKRTLNSKKSISPAAAPVGSKDARAGKNTTSTVVQATVKPIVDLTLPSIFVKKNYPTVDHESVQFSEMNCAVEIALTALVDSSESNGETKEKKEKKKTPVAEVFKVPDFVAPPEYNSIIDHATDLFKKNIERLASKAKDHILELMDKGLITYTSLDEMVGLRFTGEMEAIRQLLLVVKEAIEAEVKLPNYLELSGDKFSVNFSVLTVEPEHSPRPESPVEKPSYYQFTCLQLLNYARQFREIAPSGLMSSKDFVDSMLRFNNLSAGTQLVPEMLINLDAQSLQQICAILDSFETGFVSWRKYLYIHSRVLPSPSVNYIVNLQAIFKACPSYNNGKISYEDFASVPLWFSEANDAKEDPDAACFNRPQKIRNSIFYIFSVKPEASGIIEQTGVPLISDHEKVDFTKDHFDTEAFLFHSCLDETASQGLEKAFYIQSKASDGYCTVEDLFKIFHFTMPLVPETHRLVEEESVNEPYPMEFLLKLFESLGVEKAIHFDEFIKVAKNYAVSLYSCPLYLLDDVTIVKSRPATGEKIGSV